MLIIFFLIITIGLFFLIFVCEQLFLLKANSKEEDVSTCICSKYSKVNNHSYLLRSEFLALSLAIEKHLSAVFTDFLFRLKVSLP